MRYSKLMIKILETFDTEDKETMTAYEIAQSIMFFADTFEGPEGDAKVRRSVKRALRALADRGDVELSYAVIEMANTSGDPVFGVVTRPGNAKAPRLVATITSKGRAEWEARFVES